MDEPSARDRSLDPPGEGRLLDVLVRAGLILALALALAMLCYQIFPPILVLMMWALILAITLYPLNRALASRLGGPQRLGGHVDHPARYHADRRADRVVGQFDG